MSVLEVADKVAEVLRTNEYPFVMCNFAPPDMVDPHSSYVSTRLTTPIMT